MLDFFRSRGRRARCAVPFAIALVASLGVSNTEVQEAQACGCLSPPVPSPNAVEYAVNQQAEQIIFEVEPGYVTAHVLIRYAGDPEQFAWIVPVPSIPDLGLSEAVTFGLLDQASSPSIGVSDESLCPSPEFDCRQHPPPVCGNSGTSGSGGSSGFATSVGVGPSGASSSSGAGGNGGPPGVEVLKKEQIGSYDTVVFSAGDAAAAVTWLQSEGFIVNSTMTPYMQPYVDANMLFVAAKLIPGANADAIAPLRMRYQASNPMIPLQLTAVAAEPHLTVTSYIFGADDFTPDGHPVVQIDAADISSYGGRNNYPMVVARAIDEAGHDGFVVEYQGAPPQPSFLDEPCCASDNDTCFIGSDGQCQCPGKDFDAQDCASQPDLLAAVDAMEQLRDTHPRMTRLTTRVSAEEMTFDPGFRPTQTRTLSGRLRLSGTRNHLDGCRPDAIDQDALQSTLSRMQCTSTYCGEGECVATSDAPGCVCNPGHVARRFSDLDSKPSVTCVPEVGAVDFGVGGIQLIDACLGVSCGNGVCVDVGGFPTCKCDAGSAGIIAGSVRAPVCSLIVEATGTKGARNYSAAIDKLAVCAPAPPQCGEFGWLVKNKNKARQGVICTTSYPADESAFEVPREPTCADYGLPPIDGDDMSPGGGCGCRTVRSSDGAPLGLTLATLGLMGLLRRRRKREPTIRSQPESESDADADADAESESDAEPVTGLALPGVKMATPG